MTTPAPTSYIHYNPERVDFSATDSELEQLCRSGHNSWKDFTIACGGVGVPCILNAITIYQAQSQFAATLAFTLNLVVGLVGVVLSVAFGIMWYRTAADVASIVTVIKAKPRIPFQPPGVSNIGQLPSPPGGNA